MTSETQEQCLTDVIHIEIYDGDRNMFIGKVNGNPVPREIDPFTYCLEPEQQVALIGRTINVRGEFIDNCYVVYEAYLHTSTRPASPVSNEVVERTPSPAQVDGELKLAEIVKLIDPNFKWGDQRLAHPTIDAAVRVRNFIQNRQPSSKEHVSEWQDISTAPHGKWILICTENDCVFQSCWNANTNHWETPISPGGRILFPKYWQEMPPALKAKEIRE